MTPAISRAVVAGVLGLGALAAAGGASADPLRLRGDALASAQAPAGLVVLSADQRTSTWLDAEALVWVGAGVGDDGAGAEADALVVAVTARDSAGRGAVRLGRFVAFAGALMPSHLDGAHARARLPGEVELEAFGGLAVAPGAAPRAFDWLAGARAGRRFGAVRLGVGFLVERRADNLLDHRELAVDAAAPFGRLDLGAAAAMDLIDPALAQLDLRAGWRRPRDRLELFVRQRAPSHLLPATSLFSVLGDVPSTRVGASASRRAAPRLDLAATAALRVAGGELDEELEADARLRLDPRGASLVSLGLRRLGGPEGGFTGGRAATRVALGPRLGLAGELELAVPDDPRGRGRLWPWALAALTLRPRQGWEVAAALEASASPTERGRLDALVRLAQVWGTR